MSIWPPEQSPPLTVSEGMDRQTKREFWFLAIGTVLVEVPFAAIAVIVLTH